MPALTSQPLGDFDSFYAPLDGNRTLPLRGRTISQATILIDEAGYPFVWLSFEDGGSFRVVEISQTGMLVVRLEH